MKIMENKTSKFGSYEEKIKAVSKIAEAGDVVRLTLSDGGRERRVKLLITENYMASEYALINLQDGCVWGQIGNSVESLLICQKSHSFIDVDIYDKDGIVINLGEAIAEEKIMECFTLPCEQAKISRGVISGSAMANKVVNPVGIFFHQTGL